MRQRRRAFGCGALAVLSAAAIAAAGAHAQANPCDALKTTLAARIESTGVRGFSLEAVPARTAVPPGAKVIGTCESGATKILYRRSGAARAASAAVSEAKPASPPPAVVLPSEPKPAARSDEAAPAAASASRVTANAPAARASEPETMPIVEHAPSPPPPVPVDRPVDAKSSPTRQALDFMTDQWPWIAALVLLLPIAVWLRAWRKHRHYYDEAGLPRGPKL